MYQSLVQHPTDWAHYSAHTTQCVQLLRAQSLLNGSVLHLLSQHGHTRNAQRLHADKPAWVHKVKDYLESHFENDIKADELAAIAGVSRIHLNRVFIQAIGTPPLAYLNAIRIRQAQRHLRAGEAAIDVATKVGFADQSHLIRRFKGSLGVTPRQWQKLYAAPLVASKNRLSRRFFEAVWVI